MAFADQTDGGRIIVWHDFPIPITMDEVCEPGDLLCYDGAWKKADGDATGASVLGMPAKLIAGERCDATSGGSQNIQAYSKALIDFGTACTASAIALIYLSDTAGQYDISAGTSTQVVGHMVDNHTAIVEPKPYVHALIADAATTVAGYATINAILDVLALQGVMLNIST